MSEECGDNGRGDEGIGEEGEEVGEIKEEIASGDGRTGPESP